MRGWQNALHVVRVHSFKLCYGIFSDESGFGRVCQNCDIRFLIPSMMIRTYTGSLSINKCHTVTWYYLSCHSIVGVVYNGKFAFIHRLLRWILGRGRDIPICIRQIRKLVYKKYEFKYRKIVGLYADGEMKSNIVDFSVIINNNNNISDNI